jgi:hypothetical protein
METNPGGQYAKVTAAPSPLVDTFHTLRRKIKSKMLKGWLLDGIARMKWPFIFLSILSLYSSKGKKEESNSMPSSNSQRDYVRFFFVTGSAGLTRSYDEVDYSFFAKDGTFYNPQNVMISQGADHYSAHDIACSKIFSFPNLNNVGGVRISCYSRWGEYKWMLEFFTLVACQFPDDSPQGQISLLYEGGTNAYDFTNFTLHCEPSVNLKNTKPFAWSHTILFNTYHYYQDFFFDGSNNP